MTLTPRHGAYGTRASQVVALPRLFLSLLVSPAG